MIQAKELRVGNILALNIGKARHGEKYIFVESISQTGINVEFREYNLEDLQPIELTPEIVGKFGAIKVDLYKGSRYSLKLKKDSFEIRFTKNYVFVKSNSVRSMKIKYLHTFQNLVFALTDEELDVKL